MLGPLDKPERSPSTSDRPWRLHIGFWVGLLVALVLIASIGYRLVDPRYTWLQALYMTVITISSVGYREVHELEGPGQIWSMVIIVFGRVIVAVVIALIVASVVEMKVRKLLGRRQLRQQIARLSGHVIVCGYGRVGQLVSDELIAAGREVVVVDRDPDRTAAAESTDVAYILGDAQEDAVLASAGVAQAEVLVAALGADAENVFVTLSARQANPSLRIIAEARGLSAQDKLLKAGASRVVCPQIIGANRIASVVLRPAVVDFVDKTHRGVDLEMDQVELTTDSALVGRTLQQIGLPQRTGAHVITIQRGDGTPIYRPTPDLALKPGDVLVVIGPRGSAEAARKLQRESAPSPSNGS